MTSMTRVAAGVGIAVLAFVLMASCSPPDKPVKTTVAAAEAPITDSQPSPTSLPASKPARTLPPGRLDMVYSLDANLPHTPWAKPYARGPVKAWILSPIVPTGDTISLLKRFDLDYDIVSCDMSWEMNTWGLGDAYGKRSNKDAKGRALELGYATEDLTSNKHYDVMILPTVIGWNSYPEKMRQAIAKRVRDGAGLVLISPQDCKEQPADTIVLPELSPLLGATPVEYHWYGDWDKLASRKDPAPWKVVAGQEKHPIVSGVCWESMPMGTAVALHDFKKVADGATLLVEAGGTPVLATRQVGAGRVVAINWYAGRHSSGLTPEEDAAKCPSWDYWEQFYNLLGRATLWAAGKEPEGHVTIGEVRDGKAPVDVDLVTAISKAQLRLIVKDGRGRVVSDRTTPAALGAGKTTVPLTVGPLPGGTNHLEVIVSSARGSVAWAARQVTVPKLAEIAEVSVTPDAVANGQELSGVVKLTGKLPVGNLKIELRDPFGRVLAARDEPAKLDGDASVPFRFKVENVVSLVLFVRATLTQDQATLGEKDSVDCVVTPSEPRFADYEVIPWGFTARRDLWGAKADAYRQFHATGNSQASPQTTRAGFVVKGHAEPPTHTLGIYWFDPGRERLVNLWKEFKDKGDKSTLTREVCLSDPATLKAAEDAVRAKVKAQKKYNPGIYYIGDESSVSAYSMEVELDFCPKALDDFRGWLKARYGTIEKLNVQWQTPYKDFAEIIPFTILEVEKDAAKAVGWSEHRTFMEERYEDVLKLIRKVGKEEDPNAEFELTGTQSATSFDGIDWARHTRHVKRFVPYNINFAYDQLRCFNPGVKMSALTGYGSRGSGVKLSLWSQAMHGLLSANIFWEWSLVNPDFSLSANARDIGETFAELRGKGIGRLIGTAHWVKSPVAIYYSQPSIHAARVQKREAICHEARNAWCQVTRDLGLQFDMLSYFQVEEGTWLQDPPKVLVLPAALAVSPAEAKNLVQYVENGGTLVADMPPGLCDDRCDFRQDKLLAKLFGDGKTPGVREVGKGKAILLEKDFRDYVKQRAAKRGAEVRAQAGTVFADAGAQGAIPVRVGGRMLDQAETVVLQNGSWKMLGILKENVTGIRRTSEDGVEYFEPLKEGQTVPSERISAALGGKFHVYNVRTGQYLGRSDTITDDLDSAETKLYALLPYQVKGMSLKTDGKFAPGALLRVQASLVTESGAAMAQHVFNVRAFDRDGKELHYYARNLVTDSGRADLAFPVELNPKGPFRIVVTDVLTGISATYEFK